MRFLLGFLVIFFFFPSFLYTTEACGHERAVDGVYRNTWTCSDRQRGLGRFCEVAWVQLAGVSHSRVQRLRGNRDSTGRGNKQVKASRHCHPESRRLPPWCIKASYCTATSLIPQPGRLPGSGHRKLPAGLCLPHLPDAQDL